jgi:hypothetical protein
MAEQEVETLATTGEHLGTGSHRPSYQHPAPCWPPRAPPKKPGTEKQNTQKTLPLNSSLNSTPAPRLPGPTRPRFGPLGPRFGPHGQADAAPKPAPLAESRGSLSAADDARRSSSRRSESPTCPRNRPAPRKRGPAAARSARALADKNHQRQ